MALDDFTDIDDETLGGLGDLFDEALADVTATHTASRDADAAAEAERGEDPTLEASDDGSGDADGTDMGEANGANELDDSHFLDDAAIDDELLSSVEDVLSELDDMETSEEELFGLHSELGAPQRASRKPGNAPDHAPDFPDVHPVESVRLHDDQPSGAAYAVQAVGRARGGWLPTVAVLAANLALLLFAWGASRSLQAGLRDVRDELDEVRSTTVTAEGPRTAGAGSNVVPGGARSEPLATGSETARDVAPLPTFDQVALEIAQRELERGLYTSARRRLYGVLALANRIEPERREDVEARLSFMIADSYRFEAEVRREVPQ